MDKLTKLNIMGTEFSISYGKLPNNELGETIGVERKIRISNKLSGEQLKSTIIHELLHAILYITGQSERLDHDFEEAIVIALEHGLTPLVDLRVDK